ncbi:hypothetical protein [Anaerohalosphaera lusitana]|uniref:hypothetical protein n=1 Tax=Anaerohalosphaera lusitana TaxID=1936003 RepID=UPI0011BA9A05|nr:hypothetical protein [Anaerohalosphaera lusitana]
MRDRGVLWVRLRRMTYFMLGWRLTCDAAGVTGGLARESLRDGFFMLDPGSGSGMTGRGVCDWRG